MIDGILRHLSLFIACSVEEGVGEYRWSIFLAAEEKRGLVKQQRGFGGVTLTSHVLTQPLMEGPRMFQLSHPKNNPSITLVARPALQDEALAMRH